MVLPWKNMGWYADMKIGKKKGIFSIIAEKTAAWAGTSPAFLLAFATVIIWAISGPMFGFSETWQLVINTGTTIITFLMVFLIQNSQNRDTRALQIKLDELIRVTEGAHTALLDLEELSDKELAEICGLYTKIAQESRKRMRQGEADTHVPDVDFDGKKGKKQKKK